MNVIRNMITALYYQLWLYYYCFQIPYEQTLKYYSGYGIAVNKHNNKKMRLKGAIIYAFLWWLPFVVSLIAGTCYSLYFTAVGIIKAGAYFCQLTLGTARCLAEKMKELWLSSASNLAEFYEAFKELLEDIFNVIYQFFSSPVKPENEEKPWSGAILMTDLRTTVAQWGQTLNETSNEIEKIQKYSAKKKT